MMTRPVEPVCAARQAALTVDLDAVEANYRLLSDVGRPAETAPVVKADGYGLGAGPVTRRLWAAGARSFFVARVAEGEALRRELGRDRPAVIHVLDGCPPGAQGALAGADLSPVLNSLVQIDDWSAHALRCGRHLACALHIDTGLNRLGLRVEEAAALALSPARLHPLDLQLVMSHLACASEPGHPMNARQAERFAQAAALFPGVRRSLANSAGLFLGPAYALELTRPGISLYGGGPFGRQDPRLKPVVRLDAPILQVRSVPPGETIGYGATYRTTRATQVAIVAAGYADGVLRAASPGAYGWLDGRRCDIVGRISMDLIALDVSDCDTAMPGALVQLIGPDVALDDVARQAGTIAYELLTRLSARLPRLYVGEAG